MSYGQQYAGYPPGVAYSQPVGVYDVRACFAPNRHPNTSRQNYQSGAYPYSTPGRSMSQYGECICMSYTHYSIDRIP